MYNFIVEDGYNSSYIDTLLMSLFYTPSDLENIFLNNDPKNIYNIYLQELIKNRFTDALKDHNSILFETINEIRNNLFMYGWLDYETICDNQNVINFYKYFADLFIQPIQIQKTNEIENIYHIDIKCDASDQIITIKDTFNDWLNNNEIINIPQIIPFNINKTNNNKINIQKRIKIEQNNKTNDWIFHSAICCQTDVSNSYYCILQNCGKWFLYDNNNIPCIKEIKMNDKEITDKIMSDVCLIFYIYDK